MPGITFTVLESPPPRPVLADTGTGFMVAKTSTHPADPTLAHSFEEWKADQGTRVTPYFGYDTAETFFRAGGARLWTVGLDSGADADDHADALDLFPIDLGPGQVFVPGSTDEVVHEAILAHCAENNRRGLLDGPDSADDGALSAAALAAGAGSGSGEASDPNRRYGGMWGNWLIVPGVVANTTRTVPPCGVVAGMIAKSDRTKSPNIPAAGLQEPIPAFVTGVHFEFDRDTTDALADDNVNVFATRFQALQNYGFRSLASKDEDPAWWQFSNSRLVMAIVARALAVSQRYLFAQIDAQRQKLAEFEGALRGEAFLPFWGEGSLFGATPGDAFSVDATSIGANSDQDIADGHIRALCAVRPSPFAETVEFQITNVPTTQPLSA